MAFWNVRKFFLVALLVFPGLVFAQAKSYSYEAINFDIAVNQDSTFDVVERQIFDYRGSFHAATRDIPLRLVGSIINVSVIDGTTGEPLQFSAKRLDKLDPSSWGKYTRYRSGGVEHIEWYYDLTDTVHEWVIRYQVHGGLSFYRDHDELYWNLFTDYQVPVGRVEARIILPVNNFAISQLRATPYASSVTPSLQILDNRTFNFLAFNLPPREKLTIAVGWPKGLVSEQSYWLDWAKINWAYLLSLISALGSFLYGLGFWLKHEKLNQGRGTVVAQYEPPQKLKPAMAEVIIKEKITDKAWSATIIDLAVRGYVSITEDKPRAIGEKILKFIGFIWTRGSIVVPTMGILAMLIYFTWPNLGLSLFNFLLTLTMVFFILAVFLGVTRVIGKSTRIALFPPDYLVLKLKSFDDSALEDYEKEFLNLLFSTGGRFSTKELRRADNTKKQDFSRRLIALKTKLYKETEHDTGAYEVEVSKESKIKLAVILTVFGLIFLAFFVGRYIEFQYYFLFATIVFCIAALVSFVRYETRLSKEGQILKEEWLGFKLYLEMAEKYRLQNLTPDLFEKYLPYAIIFGVEKKWGRAFAHLSMTPPEWYHGAGVAYAGSVSSSVSGFSASAFSASFSSSFTSAFASSGASGGASGGGGGAGGGGGGGGGGAS